MAHSATVAAALRSRAARCSWVEPRGPGSHPSARTDCAALETGSLQLVAGIKKTEIREHAVVS
eukprot:1515106-Prymnesium_polylepis.1